MHSCPAVSPAPHVGGPVTGPGYATVLIGGMPAATAGDACSCIGPPDVIVAGSSGVLIGGKPAARMGDTTAHGGVIVGGCGSVLIGERKGRTLFLENEVSEGDTDALPPEEERSKMINEAIKDCTKQLQRKLKSLNRGGSTILKKFKRWYGTDDEIARAVIIKRIQNAVTLLRNLQISDFVILENDRFRNRTYAMVHPEDDKHTIFLGDKFWKAGIDDNIPKSFVLIHELSHFDDIGSTLDYDYGVPQCRYLAKNNLNKALYNADTFAYFIQS
jgi:uncharacterized Zn-binding protein involved in type VI secretion